MRESQCASMLDYDDHAFVMTRRGLLSTGRLLPRLYSPEHRGVRYTSRSAPPASTTCSCWTTVSMMGSDCAAHAGVAVPAVTNASAWMACIDAPARKARFRIAFTNPGSPQRKTRQPVRSGCASNSA